MTACLSDLGLLKYYLIQVGTKKVLGFLNQLPVALTGSWKAKDQSDGGMSWPKLSFLWLNPLPWQRCIVFLQKLLWKLEANARFRYDYWILLGPVKVDGELLFSLECNGEYGPFLGHSVSFMNLLLQIPFFVYPISTNDFLTRFPILDKVSGFVCHVLQQRTDGSKQQTCCSHLKMSSASVFQL